jgi:hypothetical protein
MGQTRPKIYLREHPTKVQSGARAVHPPPNVSRVSVICQRENQANGSAPTTMPWLTVDGWSDYAGDIEERHLIEVAGTHQFVDLCRPELQIKQEIRPDYQLKPCNDVKEV